MARRPRRLVIVRHAKAQPTGLTDHERGLAERGQADAADSGRWLRQQGVVPDAALVSDARRAQETWAEVASGAAWDVVPELSASLYSAGTDTAFDLVRDTAPDVETLVVVGHNPTMASLAELLDDGDGDTDATTSRVTRGFPPASVAVFAITGEWADVDEGSGRLEAYHVGDG